MSSKMYHGKLISIVIKKPFLGLILQSNVFQFFWLNKKDVIVNNAKTNATGPLVKIPNPKNTQAEMHWSLSSLAILLQNKSKLIPNVPVKRASLTAVLLQIIISGDKAKLNDATIGVRNCLSPFWGQQNKVSPIINIKNNDPNAEGSLAESVPKLSQISFFGNE